MKDKYYDHLIHGADYNPDQWIDTKEIWDEDLRLMDLAHVNSATVGIFAWSMLEPAEGQYDFGWLDEIMERLATAGKKAILATPSGARPVWMAKSHPEVLRVEETGLRNEYGVRHNHCLTSPYYREKVRQINALLAQRYQNHPALLMWHISNEYSGECHCELCQQAFRDWLRREYDNDIEKLNFQWWNGFWSHKMSSFDEISSPKFRGENHVPALKLAWRRFTSDQHISFYENEIAPLREYTPDVPVTTNLMRLYTGIDYHKLAKKLDVVSWDNYPAWCERAPVDTAVETAFVHDVFRSMKDGKPFYMMESTPAQVNWFPVNKLPDPGVHVLEALQAIAHGADSVQYFQWRKSRGGHEKFHGAVVDHYGKADTRVFREVAEVGKLMEQLDAVAGGRTTAKAAVIADWENSWAIDVYCGFRRDGRDYFGVCQSWYRALWQRGVACDVVSMDAPLGGYDLVIAPYLYMLKPGAEDALVSYVENGGTLVSGYLTGLVDRDDLCYLGGFPGGRLKALFGVWVEETDALYDGERMPVIYNGKTYAARDVCDIMHLQGAAALATYGDRFYAGTPALTAHAFGKGRAYYAGSRFDDALIADFTDTLIKDAGLSPDLDATLPLCVTARRRGDLIFVMNFSAAPASLPLGHSYSDHLTGQTVSTLALPAYGYAVLEEIKK